MCPTVLHVDDVAIQRAVTVSETVSQTQNHIHSETDMANMDLLGAAA